MLCLCIVFFLFLCSLAKGHNLYYYMYITQEAQLSYSVCDRFCAHDYERPLIVACIKVANERMLISSVVYIM
jgi:hypothetical protein